jgi:hypothetical protein
MLQKGRGARGEGAIRKESGRERGDRSICVRASQGQRCGVNKKRFFAKGGTRVGCVGVRGGGVQIDFLRVLVTDPGGHWAH